MYSDVDCPYCGVGQEINHDDGYGYEEGEVYTQECSDCGKTFTYITEISFYYEAEQAPCQNGEDHNWQPIKGCPEEYYAGKKRCSWCCEEIVDREVNDAAMKKYWEKMNA
ncbi:MAG: hypothetical protein Q8910_00615 [Bacteroidota bacterium]|nr:hypothetical protein [Bacteroidota bacterium]